MHRCDRGHSSSPGGPFPPGSARSDRLLTDGVIGHGVVYLTPGRIPAPRPPFCFWLVSRLSGPRKPGNNARGPGRPVGGPRSRTCRSPRVDTTSPHANAELASCPEMGAFVCRRAASARYERRLSVPLLFLQGPPHLPTPIPQVQYSRCSLRGGPSKNERYKYIPGDRCGHARPPKAGVDRLFSSKGSSTPARACAHLLWCHSNPCLSIYK